MTLTNASQPIVSTTSVYSIPFNSSTKSQNTFSSDIISISPNSSTINIKQSKKNLYYKHSSPSLKSAIHSKKHSLYKARKSSSKNLISLISTSSNETKHSNTSQTSSLLVSHHIHSPTNNLNVPDLSSPSSSLTLNDSDSYISYLSNIELCSEISSSNSVNTIYEVDINVHPLLNVKNDDIFDSTTIIPVLPKNESRLSLTTKSNMKNVGNITKTSKSGSIFTTFKNKIKKSSIVTSTKNFYKSNELFFSNNQLTTTTTSFSSSPSIPINNGNKDIVLHDMLPLETYQISHKRIQQPFKSGETNIIPKSRECRVNPIFLRLFAIDSTIKNKYSYALPSNSTLDYYQYEFINSRAASLDEFLNNIKIDLNDEDSQNLKNSLKFSLLSRDKMYSRVILPPRHDSTNHLNTNSKFIKIKNEPISNGSSIVRENSTVIPWLKLDDCNNKRCFNPSGVLPNNIQYTVKNWEDERWSPITN